MQLARNETIFSTKIKNPTNYPNEEWMMLNNNKLKWKPLMYIMNLKTHGNSIVKQR